MVSGRSTAELSVKLDAAQSKSLATVSIQQPSSHRRQLFLLRNVRNDEHHHFVVFRHVLYGSSKQSRVHLMSFEDHANIFYQEMLLLDVGAQWSPQLVLFN